MRYPVVLTPDDNGTLLVTCPDIPEFTSCGDGEADALTQAVDGLETALDFYFEEKQLVPLPSQAKRGQKTVALPPSVAATVLLHNEMLKQHIRPAELARRLNIPQPEMNRYLNPRHNTKLDSLSRAFEAMGKHLELEIS